MKEVTADGICFLRSVKLPRRAHAAGAVHCDALHGKQRRHRAQQLRLLPPRGRPAGQRTLFLRRARRDAVRARGRHGVALRRAGVLAPRVPQRQQHRHRDVQPQARRRQLLHPAGDRGKRRGAGAGDHAALWHRHRPRAAALRRDGQALPHAVGGRPGAVDGISGHADAGTPERRGGRTHDTIQQNRRRARVGAQRCAAAHRPRRTAGQ